MLMQDLEFAYCEPFSGIMPKVMRVVRDIGTASNAR